MHIYIMLDHFNKLQVSCVQNAPNFQHNLLNVYILLWNFIIE